MLTYKDLWRKNEKKKSYQSKLKHNEKNINGS